MTVDHGIVELSSNEVDEVSGGILPLLGGLLVGFALAAGADYLNGGFND